MITDNPWLLAAVGLFHSVMWGAIFTLSVDKLGKYTSKASGVFMGGADFVNVLFSEFLEYDPENPRWEGRDRFFLDPGHMIVFGRPRFFPFNAEKPSFFTSWTRL